MGMDYYRTLNAVPKDDYGSVIAIGNFDGVHKGHNIIVDKARTLAETIKTKAGILTFEPHPRSVFRPDERPFRITPEPVKKDRLAQTGIDFTVALTFNWDFASLDADTFIQKILRDGLKAGFVVVGYDFRFGQLRQGTPETLKQAGLEVLRVDKLVREETDDPYSSSAIRQHLRHGDIAKANALLGWEWEIRGEVVRGDQRGRELGYPTANVALGDTVHPAYGVYVSRVQIEGEDTWHPAVTNIGIRPMFEVPTAQVETYIFDFCKEIYGKTVRVRPVSFLRGEAKFDSLDALISQMDRDCENARSILQKIDTRNR